MWLHAVATQQRAAGSVNFQSPDTGRPAGIGQTCWLPARDWDAEEVELAGTHRAIVKPPLGTVHFIRKSPCSRSLRPQHPLLCGATDRTAKKLQGKTNSAACWHHSERPYNCPIRRQPATRPNSIRYLTSALKDHIWYLITNRTDAVFTDHWMMRRSDRSAPLTADFLQRLQRRCGKKNMMFTSTFCCISCKSYVSSDHRVSETFTSRWVGTLMLCCVAKWK